MSDNFTYAFRRFVDWFTRIRSLAFNLVLVGAGLLVAAMSGFSVSVAGKGEDAGVDLSISTAEGVPFYLGLIAVVAGVALIALGAWRLWTEWREGDRRRVLAIEVRGLRDWNGPPLSESVPIRFKGRRENIAMDLRQRVVDGEIVDPVVAIERLATLRATLETYESGRDRRDIEYVIGGLAPVPLMFLAGALVDDESPITIMDWDRHQKIWRELDEADDGKRFIASGLDEVPPGATEVMLAISASYHVDVAGAQAKHVGCPLIQLELQNASTTSHWSMAKQEALSVQFVSVLVQLNARGVKTAHIFLAGPASLVVRFGSHFDRRNMPAVLIYQYDQSVSPPFTWAVAMPSGQGVAAQVVGA